jgi:outer membrane protein assembly factor BamB
MSDKIWRPPKMIGGRQTVGWTILFYAYNFFQKHRMTERLYLSFAAGTLFVGDGDRVIAAVRASDGKILWRFPTNSGMSFPPALIVA